MIEKIEMPEMDETYKSAMFAKVLGNKINELVDVVNALIKENNIHEKQIDRLQSTISKMEKVETPAENVQPDAESLPVNVPTNKDFITITADDVLVDGESVREYNGEKIYNYYHLPAYFKEIRDDVAEKGIKLLEIHCLQSLTDGEYAEKGNPTPDKNGCSAWCRCIWEKDGEKHTGAWVFYYTYGSAADCANCCARDCAYDVRNYAGFRAAVFGDAD